MNIQYIKQRIFLVVLPVLLLSSKIAQAQAPDADPDGGSGAPLKSVDDILKLLDKIQQWAAQIFWIIAIIAVFYSAYLYATSAGDKAAITKARDQLKYAILAMAIAILAYGLPELVKNILSAGAGG
jgi:magnesium-transporting ATPase (P-type)